MELNRVTESTGKIKQRLIPIKIGEELSRDVMYAFYMTIDEHERDLAIMFRAKDGNRQFRNVGSLSNDVFYMSCLNG